MKHYLEKLIDKKLQFIACLGWIAGLLLAGSDNSHMPWPNLLGLVLFYFSTVLMGRGMILLEKKGIKNKRVMSDETAAIPDKKAYEPLSSFNYETGKPDYCRKTVWAGCHPEP